jgi:hypothetical protein
MYIHEIYIKYTCYRDESVGHETETSTSGMKVDILTTRQCETLILKGNRDAGVCSRHEGQ